MVFQVLSDMGLGWQDLGFWFGGFGYLVVFPPFVTYYPRDLHSNGFLEKDWDVFHAFSRFMFVLEECKSFSRFTIHEIGSPCVARCALFLEMHPSSKHRNQRRLRKSPN